MSAQLKEALAALDRLEELPFDDERRDMATIRTALEMAARESEAWEAIEAWVAVSFFRRDWDLSSKPNGECEFALYDTAPEEGKEFNGKNRLEALEAAAEWCRGEMAK